MPDLSPIMNPPIRQEWLDGHPAYESGNAELVRAYLRLLKSAFRATVPGTINASSTAIAMASGLSDEDVVIHWECLTSGWILQEDGLLHHEGVAKLCAEVEDQYGEQLMDLRVRLVAAEVAALAIANGVSVKSKKPGRKAQPKRGLPENFGLTPDIVRWLSDERGVTHPYHQQFLMDGFINYAQSKAPVYADWDAAFKSNVDMTLRSCRQLPMPPGEGAPEPHSAHASPPFGSRQRPSFGAPQVARQNALRSTAEDVFSRAEGRDASRGSGRPHV